MGTGGSAAQNSSGMLFQSGTVAVAAHGSFICITRNRVFRCGQSGKKTESSIFHDSNAMKLKNSFGCVAQSVSDKEMVPYT